MTIKNKLRLGFIFLFVIALICSGLAIYFLNQLSADARLILKDNYKSVQYTKNIASLIDAGTGSLTMPEMKVIEKNLSDQEHNITEPGEELLTDSLRSKYAQLKLLGSDPQKSTLLRNQIRSFSYSIMQLNMNAIGHKNNKATTTANKATILMALIGTLCFVVAFSFIVNYPGYIANPIRELTKRITEVSKRNYRQQLNFKSNDEFGELAQAFNIMTVKLDEYENSNLASILFEKKRIETIINSMHDAILGLDDRSIIIFANEVACKLIGLSQERLVGTYAPDAALENDLLRSMLIDEQHKMKIYADERESYYSKEILTVNNEGRIIGRVILLKNITEYQQLDEAKTNFIATISHELKTPIAAIKMSLKLLDDNRIGALNQEQKKLLENIQEDTRRLLKITGELLDIAQVETGNITLNFASTHPKNIVDYAIKAVNSIARQKQVNISVTCSPDLPEVRADLDKATWVLTNLLSNAIKYSPEKSEVEMVVKKLNKKEVSFEVTDHGQGIEPKYQSRIFERYFKVPNSSNEQAGTGLGLAISKDFIEAQGGKLNVESEVGEGSRFKFCLPVC